MPATRTAQGVRDLAILTVMLKTALRGICIHRADVEVLRTLQGLLVLHYQGKGRIEKTKKALIKDGTVVKVETALRGLVTGYMKAAGVVGNKSTHSLRHPFHPPDTAGHRHAGSTIPIC